MRVRAAAAIVGCVMVLTACASTAPGQSGPSPSGSTPTSQTGSPEPSATAATGPEGLDVTSLVGNWFVTGDGAENGLMATVAPDEFRVWQRCGAAFAPWRASPSGLFAAQVSSWSGPCGDRPELPWLEKATGWRPDGATIVLLGSTGAEVGRLTPGASPTADANTTPDYATPPPVTDEVRAVLDAAPTLGAGVTSGSTPEMLVGSWIAKRPGGGSFGGPDKPGITVNDDGTWSGSDGCNGSGGRWASDGMSRLVATSGPSTLIGCDGVNAPGWFSSAWLAAFDGDELVLFGYDGKELGRLTRA